MTVPKIAVLGAGPAGLTLARLLQKNSISCTIYELDTSRNTRSQGGTLDLHPKTGQVAMKEAGLWEEFVKHSRPEGDADKLLRYDGFVYWDDNLLREEEGEDGRGEEGRKPEIDREVLRGLLLDSVEEGTLQWGKKVVDVERDEEIGKSMLCFADGTKEEGIDLLIGADGAWSKVRPHLTEEKPFYSGVTMAELWSSNVKKSNPELDKFVGEGSMFMMDASRAIISQRMGDNSIRTYACVKQPEDWQHTSRIPWDEPEKARQELTKTYFDDCSPDLKHTITGSKDALIVRPLYMLPVGIKWEHRKGVTLIGDAAHLMTPFAGVGVNLAMTDALMLARALVERKEELGEGKAIDEAVVEYEESMFENAKKMAERTAKGLESHFNAEGGKERGDMMRGYYEKETGKRFGDDYFNVKK